LADSANDGRPLEELLAESRQVGQRYVEGRLIRPLSDQPELAEGDPIQCEPDPLVRTLMAPPAFLIDVTENEVIHHHENWNTQRRIPFGEPGEVVGEPSRLGSSWAHFEGESLVRETFNLSAQRFPPGAVTTDGMRLVER
jgi:hypothetical protein